MLTYVIAKDGTILMPTYNIKKVRKLLKSKRARIAYHDPFTIQLLYPSTKYTQPNELKASAEYQKIKNKKGVCGCRNPHKRKL